MIIWIGKGRKRRKEGRGDSLPLTHLVIHQFRTSILILKVGEIDKITSPKYKDIFLFHDKKKNEKKNEKKEDRKKIVRHPITPFPLLPSTGFQESETSQITGESNRFVTSQSDNKTDNASI